MRTFRHVGFFRELTYGDRNGPVLRELIRETAHPDEERIVRYLHSGTSLVVCPGVVYDVLDPTSGVIDGGPYIHTDGKWVWLLELAYYVQRYHVCLPEEFVEDMRRHGWVAPIFTDEERGAVCEEYIRWGQQQLAGQE